MTTQKNYNIKKPHYIVLFCYRSDLLIAEDLSGEFPDKKEKKIEEDTQSQVAGSTVEQQTVSENQDIGQQEKQDSGIAEDNIDGRYGLIDEKGNPLVPGSTPSVERDGPENKIIEDNLIGKNDVKQKKVLEYENLVVDPNHIIEDEMILRLVQQNQFCKQKAEQFFGRRKLLMKILQLIEDDEEEEESEGDDEEENEENENNDGKDVEKSNESSEKKPKEKPCESRDDGKKVEDTKEKKDVKDKDSNSDDTKPKKNESENTEKEKTSDETKGSIEEKAASTEGKPADEGAAEKKSEDAKIADEPKSKESPKIGEDTQEEKKSEDAKVEDESKSEDSTKTEEDTQEEVDEMDDDDQDEGATKKKKRDSHKSPIFIHGKAGSGLSSIMAKTAHSAKTESPNRVLVSRFVGFSNSASSESLFDFLFGICHQLRRAFGKKVTCWPKVFFSFYVNSDFFRSAFDTLHLKIGEWVPIFTCFENSKILKLFETFFLILIRTCTSSSSTSMIFSLTLKRLVRRLSFYSMQLIVLMSRLMSCTRNGC